MKIAVVGAGGFVGQALTRRLQDNGHAVVPIVRTPSGLTDERPIKDLLSADWPTLLDGVGVVVQLAARVHIMNDTATDPLAEFRRVNRDGSIALFSAAARAGVKRYLFVSTIKVNGEATQLGAPFRADDPPAPADPYGISKLEAELALARLAEEGGPELAIVRPPLVHGPGVRANFETMMRWLQRGVPLPFGRITQNRRTLIGIDNLVDLLVTCLLHPAAANQTFMAGDGQDVSTAQLLRLLSASLGRPARLLPVPISLLQAAARLAGRGAAIQRLTGSLQADIAKTRTLLGWTPPISLEEGLRRTAAAFLSAAQ